MESKSNKLSIEFSFYQSPRLHDEPWILSASSGSASNSKKARRLHLPHVPDFYFRFHWHGWFHTQRPSLNVTRRSVRPLATQEVFFKRLHDILNGKEGYGRRPKAVVEHITLYPFDTYIHVYLPSWAISRNSPEEKSLECLVVTCAPFLTCQIGSIGGIICVVLGYTHTAYTALL
jgi:hypothetical protein